MPPPENAMLMEPPPALALRDGSEGAPLVIWSVGRELRLALDTDAVPPRSERLSGTDRGARRLYRNPRDARFLKFARLCPRTQQRAVWQEVCRTHSLRRYSLDRSKQIGASAAKLPDIADEVS
jgi:hypothetical protein